MAEEAKNSGWKAIALSIFSAIVIALVVGKDTPYWFKYFGNKPAEVKSAAPLVSVTAKDQEPAPVASKQFVLGRWHAEVSMGASNAHANTLDFFPNGRFDGDRSGTDTRGELIHVSGGWKFEKVSESEFIVDFKLDPEIPLTPARWTIKYKIIDQNHIENLNGGFIVNRMN